MPPFTKKAIITSTLRISAKRPVSKVKVKDIVEDCGITRNTFYYYFQDVYDVLQAAFQEEIDKINNGQYPTVEVALTEFCNFIYTHRNTVLNLYHFTDRDLVDDFITKSARPIFEDIVRKRADNITVPQETFDLTVSFFMDAYIGVVLRWLNSDLPQVPSEFVHRLNILFEGLVRHTLENSQNI